MSEKFELLCKGISQVHKKIQKIKKMHMKSFGLKGTHVMCIYFLSRAENGLTAAELCDLCGEDKAGISRILSDLENQDLISYESHESHESHKSDTPCSSPSSDYSSISPVSSTSSDYGSISPVSSTSPDHRKYRAHALLTEAGRAKAAIVNQWVKDAVNLGSLGISPEEEEVFYRVLFHISDNLNEAITYTENEYEQT